MVRETLKPGETVHNSGIYQGSKSGERTTLVKGNMAPVMPMRHESLDRSRSDESATKITCQEPSYPDRRLRSITFSSAPSLLAWVSQASV